MAYFFIFDRPDVVKLRATADATRVNKRSRGREQ
nr:MAG TPA: hypothetical protein [Caudoviricetes sp.]